MSTLPCALAALVTPALFVAGAAASAVPIVIHLLAKRRFQRIRWAAVEFLVLAEKENRRKINLRQLVLLALRCLALALLGLLLARPFANPAALLAALGSGSGALRICILDDSFSMGYRHGASSTFDRARDDLLRLVEGLQQRGGHDRLTVLLTSQPAAPLIESQRLDTLEVAELGDRLAARAPAEVPANIAGVLRGLADRLRGDPEATAVTIHVLSDLQKTDWLPAAADGDRGTSPLQAFADWPEAHTLSIVLMPAGDLPRPNLAVTALGSEQSHVVATLENRMTATVRNWSTEAAPAGRLTVYLEDAALPDVAVPEIPAGAAVQVGLDVTFPAEGPQTLRVQLAPDALAIDDQRLVTYDVQAAIRVLLVDGEPSSSRLEDEVSLLKTALRPEGETFSGFDVTVIGESDLATARFDRYHEVILANVYRLDREAARQLQEFVEGGGGLAVFLGDQIDSEWYNERLWQDGQGLLPCQVGPRIRSEPGQTPAGLQVVDPTHPLLRAFAGDDSDLFGEVWFWEYVDCVMPQQPAETAERLATRTIARFSDGRDSPAVAESRPGRGRVLVLTSTADLEWNNWAKWPSYVVVMQELGHCLAAAADHLPETTAGEPLHVLINADAYQPDATVRPPGYPAVPESAVRGTPTADGHAYDLAWEDTGHRGVYRFVVAETSGQPAIIEQSVNVDPTESRLESCAEHDLRRSAPQIPFRYVDPSATPLDEPIEHQREFWPVLLMMVLAVLLLEQTLACWFGRTA